MRVMIWRTRSGGDGTLNYTAVNSLFLANGPFATAVTMNGVSTANITSATTFATAGFSGNITGLTTVAASTATPGQSNFTRHGRSLV